LWDARTALAEGDRPTFDQAVYNALAAFGDSESFDTARQKIVAETQVLLGGTASATVDAKMAGRGLNGCNNRVVSVALGAARGFIFLQGTNIFPMPFIAVPAPFQFSVNLTKAAQKMFLTVDKRGAESSTANLRVLIKPGSDPILWDPDLLTNDATRSIPYSVLVNKTVEIPGPFPPGPMTVQLANGSDGQVILLGLIIYTDEEGMPVASPPDAAPVVMMTGDGGGCCQVGGGAGASGAFVLVAVTLLSLRRRRR
jgi:MYXO-CTERM domain-containing protein